MPNLLAFTLIELLVVIAIIGILAGLTVNVVWKTDEDVSNQFAVNDMMQLDMVLKHFKSKYGIYPADFSDPAETQRCLQTMFPKCPPNKYPDLSDQMPATALVFWLAGPNGNGFSANPLDPFDDSPSRLPPLFEFESNQMKKIGNAVQYFPPYKNQAAPYVYFRAGGSGYDNHSGYLKAKPYFDTRTNRWMNRTSFQILCAGRDGQFGSGNKFPTGENYDEANRDDLANFSGGKTMENNLP